MYQTSRVVFFVILLFITFGIALEPAFFDSLEQRMRDDYHLCTENSKDTSLKTIIQWKHSTDSIIDSESYDTIFSHFIKATGLDPAEIRPCEPIVWYQREIDQMKDTEKIMNEIRKEKSAAKRDSLAVMEELSGLETSPVDFKGIPANTSRRSFMWLITRTPHASLEDRGLFFQVDSIAIGEGYFRGTFYFNRNGQYNMYKLESYHLPADSVNTKVRTDAALLSAYFEEKIGRAPETHNVGFLEIKQDNPSPYRSWPDVTPGVTVKLATHNHNYYAKCVIDY